MNQTELTQLELLAQVDELLRQLKEWSETPSPWQPISQSRALLNRLLGRLDTLRIRLESPLVLATFGGTGTGKSSLVNALVGRDCTRTGRQRPTTMRPVLIAHTEIELEQVGLPLEDFELIRCESELLRDVIIIDCPDPDTTEEATVDSNLERLHRLLPYCDVLLYTSTQQKYRSARVLDELGEAATGCRLLFVQTHADVDEDIRDDWKSHLGGDYEIPEIFFVDSLRAYEEQQAGRQPSGEFRRLLSVIATQLSASQRIQIRRANILDLVQAVTERCQQILAAKRPAIDQLEAALVDERSKLVALMSNRLKGELKANHGLWERRLVECVTQIWGLSPFSSMLRIYNSLRSLLASASLFRARSSAQVALIGSLQAAKWFRTQSKEKEAAQRLERLSTLGLDDSTLREAQLTMAGYVHDAELDGTLVSDRSLDALRDQAAVVEHQFLGDAGRQIDSVISELARRNSRWFTRTRYEFLFLAYLAFVLYRVGKNFFYDTFFLQIVEGNTAESTALLSVDFYIAAGVFFILWTGLLLMLFIRRLRRGLMREIDAMANELAAGKISQSLFPGLERACEEVSRQSDRLDAIAAAANQVRSELAESPQLGLKSQAAKNTTV